MPGIGRLLAMLRPAVLVVLGAVIGAGVAPAVAGQAQSRPAAATQTRSFSCPGNGFYPRDSETPYFDEDVVARGTDTDDWFYCAATLPSAAVVTQVQFTVRDDATNHQFQYCGLIRVSLVASDQAAFLTMAQVTTPNIADAPGFVRASSTSISGATINNAKYSYYLQCKFNFNGNIVDTLSLIGADVIYKISPANG